MSDTAQVAFDSAAPADERLDAQTQLQKAHMPGVSDLIPPADVRALVREIQAEYEFQSMMKAARVIPFPGREQREKGMQSVYLDNLQIFAHGDYFERPSPVGFPILRQMVEQTPILNAVIMTRARQVQRFCNPQAGGRGPGFIVGHVDRTHKLTPDETESTRLLSAFMTNCGWEFNARRRKQLKRDTLSGLVAKLLRESLTYDSAPIETEMKKDRRMGMDGFYAVDGATVALCTDEGYRGDDEIFAVQLVQGRVMTAYTHNDLIYEPRNPRADVRLAGYGLGETELLVKVVTGFLNAMTYNARGFDENAIPKGMLHLTGEYSQEDLSAFRRYWNAMVKGVSGAWTVPVMVSKDAESRASFEKFGIDFSEMAFAKWMTFLVSIICAIYGMSPAEINFDSFTGNNSSPLSGSDTSEKLASSRDSGLRPILAYLEGLFSDYIISEFAEKYVFRWTGLDEQDDTQRQEMRKLVLTVNEIRAEEGYDPMKGPIGDAPVNPSLIGPWMQIMQGPAPGEEAGAPMPGAEDDEDTKGDKPKAGLDEALAALKGGGQNDTMEKSVYWRIV